MANIQSLRQILAVCGIRNEPAPNNVTQRFIDSQGLTGIEDIQDMIPENAKDMVKSYNDGVPPDESQYRLGVPHQRKLQSLIWWVKKRAREQLPVEVQHWTTPVMRAALAEMDLEATLKDNEAAGDIKPGKIETGIGWYAWELGFTNFLSTKIGIQGRLDYVVRRDKPAGWTIAQAVNEHEATMYRLRLTGQEYDADNTTVWQLLKEAVLTTDAWTHVEIYDELLDGREAMRTLRNFYEGDGETSKRVALAKKELKTLHYRSEYSYSFVKFSTNFKKAYMVLEKHGQVYTDEQKVKAVHERMTVSNSPEFAIAKSQMLDNHRHDFNAAIQYMSMKVTEIFPDAVLEGDGRGNRRRNRSAREVQTHRRGGRGRGRSGRNHERSGRGRGGRGRGGRGRGNAYRSGASTSQLTVNGVDVSDPTRTFSPDEMERLGPRGQRYIYEQRDQIRAREGGNARGASASGATPREVRQVSMEGQDEPSELTQGQTETDNTRNADSNRGGRSGIRFGRNAHQG